MLGGGDVFISLGKSWLLCLQMCALVTQGTRRPGFSKRQHPWEMEVVPDRSGICLGVDTDVLSNLGGEASLPPSGLTQDSKQHEHLRSPVWGIFHCPSLQKSLE